MSDTTATVAPVNPLEALLNLITENTNKANAIADEAKSALGNTARDIKEARETSEDPQIVAFREWAEKHAAAYNDAVAKINEHILKAGIVKGASWDEKTTEQKKAEHKALLANIKQSKNALKVTYDAIGMPLPEFPEVKNFSGSVAKSAGGSTGTMRPRFDAITLNGEALVGKGASGRPTLSQVSQIVKSKTGETIGAGELLDMLAKEAGVTPDNLTALNDVEVEFTATDKDKVTHTFTLSVFKDAEPSEDESEVDSDESDEDSSEDE